MMLPHVKKHTSLTALLLFLSIILSGCMTFNKNTLPDVDEVKAPTKPTVIVSKMSDFKKMTNGYGNDEKIGNKIGNSILNGLVKRWSKKGLVTNSTNNQSDNENSYTLSLSGSSDEQYSPVAAKITGATFFIVPSFATVEQKVKVDLINNRTSKKYSVEAKDSYSVAMHLLFFPFFIAQNIGASNMHDHMADYIYGEMYKQGAFN